MEKQAKAELAFYRPFQANVTKVKGILKANKKPKVKIVNRMPVIEFDRDYQYLSRCENG